MLDNQGARSFYTALLSPAVTVLAKCGVSPDAVSWTGTILACGIGLGLVPHGLLWQSALALGVLVLTDGMDGQLARRTGKVSLFGAFLDSSLDRLADGAIVGGATLWLAWHDHWYFAGLGMAAVILGQVTSYTKARAESLGYTCTGGLAGRADRLVI
ncbi:MAG: CDP-alcohol phosphatidyltransferase family protein, partial [Propionibacteriaceae bacterium]